MTVAADVLLEALTRCLSTTYDETLLEECIDDAVLYYSRFNGLVVEDTIDLEAGVGVYDLPDDFIALRYFNYWPTTVMPPATEGTDP